MITFNLKKFNSDIKGYINFIADLDVETITCPDCGTLDMERHGYYKRYIII